MWVIIVLTVVLIGLIHRFLNGTYGHWKKRNVPHPNPLPFVGNLGSTLFRGRNPGVIYQEMYNNYKEYNWVGFYKFKTPAILLRNVDLIKDITTKDFASFHDNDIDMDEEKDPLFAKNPFVLKGQKWKVVRSQITAAITTGKIKNMFALVSNVNKDLINYLNKQTEMDNKDGLDAKELSVRFTTDVVAACAFGLEGKSFTDSNSEFKMMGEKLFQPEGLDALKLMILFAFPSLGKYLGSSFASNKVKDWFIGVLKETIRYRKENNIVRNDYLDLMLSLKSKPGEYTFTDIDVMAQCMTFYGDGMETSAITLSFILFELAKHLDLQKKLRKEIDKTLEKHKGEITYDSVQDIPYLDMVISETLRMHPPAIFLLKRCTKQFTLPNPRGEGAGPGVVIEPETPVMIPIIGIHYDPKYYQDPEKFIPERFTEEEKQKRSKCAYMPFGEGPRQCLGFRFALMQIKAAVVAIIPNFEVTLNSKTSPIMEIDSKALLLAKEGGIHLDFRKRI